MRSNERRLRLCFFKAPTTSGAVRVRWEVDRAGGAREVEVASSTIENAEVERCLASRVGELHFDELAAPASAEWTFVFRLAEPVSEQSKRKQKKRRKASVEGTAGVIIDKSSAGRLEPDRISGVVEKGYNLYARCYRDAINRDSSLDGWVNLRFVIGEDGRVASVLDGDSDLTDRMALDCIAESFYALEFPKPSRGDVRVLYRLRLN